MSSVQHAVDPLHLADASRRTHPRGVAIPTDQRTQSGAVAISLHRPRTADPDRRVSPPALTTNQQTVDTTTASRTPEPLPPPQHGARRDAARRIIRTAPEIRSRSRPSHRHETASATATRDQPIVATTRGANESHVCQVGAHQQRIVDAAIGVFAERGFAGGSISAIATRAGASRAQVYYYNYKNNADLLSTCWKSATGAPMSGRAKSRRRPRTFPGPCSAWLRTTSRRRTHPALRSGTRGLRVGGKPDARPFPKRIPAAARRVRGGLCPHGDGGCARARSERALRRGVNSRNLRRPADALDTRAGYRRVGRTSPPLRSDRTRLMQAEGVAFQSQYDLVNTGRLRFVSERILFDAHVASTRN
ncbi:TetR family transcriptional regulator [Microbacterium sp. Leaf288]|uniref:TetR family transcriptional regulator n=1 Tax=Microbacterium sp. Leaf288 TaxID=1736323 RepID=UPI0009EAF300